MSKTKELTFIDNYKKEMITTMKTINPDWDDEFIEKTLDEMIKDSFQNPKVTLDNNYTGESRETTLVSVLDWCDERKPVITGNGTFYKNQHEAINPIAAMLNSFATNRKNYKKQMFKVPDTDSPEYKDLDRKQLNEKILMNSYYGGSGAPSSAFFSKWSGPATTLTAQSVISTAQSMFDGFLGDNYIFIDMTEVAHWLTVVLDDYDKYESNIPITLHTVDIDVVTDRINDRIMQQEDTDRTIIRKFLSNLTKEERSYIYYKNNMIQFFEDHKEARTLLLKILSSVNNYNLLELDKKGNYKSDDNWLDHIPSEFRGEYCNKKPADWNKFVSKEYFMDPNDVPDSIKKYVEELTNYLIAFVYTPYLAFDKIYRLRNFKRRAAVVIDTDSNILALDPIMNYFIDDVTMGESFGRDSEKNDFVMVNTLTYAITVAIDNVLHLYGKLANIPEDFRATYNMKNEFYMPRMVIGKAKKRYISKIVLREGNFLNPPKNDIKGFDFKKSTCSEYAEAYFMGIIKKHIIDADDIDLQAIVNEIKKFEKEVKTSILSGERTFLPNGSVKDLSAYKDPASQQSVRGYIAWNYLNPDNMIDAPAKVSLVKMNILTPEDMVDLQTTNLEVYNIIMKNIFNDTTGIFVQKKYLNDTVTFVNVKNKEWYNDIPKKYQAKYKKLGPVAWNEFAESYSGPRQDGHYEYKSRGMQVLAIPSNDKIPEWALPYVDVNTMVNNIISPFRPVLELFGNKALSEGKTINGINRKTDKVTNIIKF